MAKNFFGEETPTYEESLAIAKGAKMCIEAKKITPEALELLEDADDKRLFTFLSDIALFVGRDFGSAAKKEQWHSHMMEYVAKAVFQGFEDAGDALGEIDETRFICISDYLDCVEKHADMPGLSKAFFGLCAGGNLSIEQVTQHRKTGKIVKRERIEIKGHDALRRGVLAAQSVLFLDIGMPADMYISFLEKEAEIEAKNGA